MPKKNGEPTKVELRILNKIKSRGGYAVLTRDEFGDHYTTPDGRKCAPEDATIAKMISAGLFVKGDDGLLPGVSQTFVPAI